jgi:hypothetical protein
MFADFRTDKANSAVQTLPHLIEQWDGEQPLMPRIDKPPDNLHVIAFASGPEPDIT